MNSPPPKKTGRSRIANVPPCRTKGCHRRLDSALERLRRKRSEIDMSAATTCHLAQHEIEDARRASQSDTEHAAWTIRMVGRQRYPSSQARSSAP